MGLQAVVNFRVVDESDDWIVVDKPAPLIVHPANRKPEPTLLGGLEQLLAYELCNGGRLGIVTRLDRETSGLVLVAKHTAAARELGGIFERRQAKKEYLAIVTGWPEFDTWECFDPILRAGEVGSSEIWVRQTVHPRGRPCTTRFRVERNFERPEGKFSLIRCFPESGRMHQIRVHLAARGFPILGDKIYSGNGSEYLEWMANSGNDDFQPRITLNRHALHSTRLEIPWCGSTISWNSELAPDLGAFVAGKSQPFPSDIVIWSRYD